MGGIRGVCLGRAEESWAKQSVTAGEHRGLACGQVSSSVQRTPPRASPQASEQPIASLPAEMRLALPLPSMHSLRRRTLRHRWLEDPFQHGEALLAQHINPGNYIYIYIHIKKDKEAVVMALGAPHSGVTNPAPRWNQLVNPSSPFGLIYLLLRMTWLIREAAWDTGAQ